MTIRTKLPFTSYGWVHDAGGSGERWRHDVCSSGGHVELGEGHYIRRLNKAHTPHHIHRREERNGREGGGK